MSGICNAYCGTFTHLGGDVAEANMDSKGGGGQLLQKQHVWHG